MCGTALGLLAGIVSGGVYVALNRSGKATAPVANSGQSLPHDALSGPSGRPVEKSDNSVPSEKSFFSAPAAGKATATTSDTDLLPQIARDVGEIKKSVIPIRRRLTEDQKKKIIASISPFKGQVLIVQYPIGHDEAMDYAQDFLETLNAAGWQASMGGPRTTSPPCGGVELGVPRPNPETKPGDPVAVPLPAQALEDVLHSLGIPVTEAVLINEVDSTGRFNLIVCRISPPASVAVQSALEQAPPTIAQLRVVSQESVVSDRSEFPYAQKVVIQTNVRIQPVSIVFEFTAPVAEGKVWFGGEQGIVFIKVRSGPLLANPKLFIASFESPAFEPDKAMIITVYAKQPIQATGRWQQVPFTFP